MEGGFLCIRFSPRGEGVLGLFICIVDIRSLVGIPGYSIDCVLGTSFDVPILLEIFLGGLHAQS
jgi:hypothetical protein